MTIFNLGKSKQMLRSQINYPSVGFFEKKNQQQQVEVLSQSPQKAFTFKKCKQSLGTHNPLSSVMLNSQLITF